jgi:hypothetical protein
MAISKETVLRRKHDALSAQVGNEVVLMNTNFDNYYGLDEIGSDIWLRLEQPIAVEKLCSALASDYEGDASAIERDLIELLEDLLKNQLIETAG